MSKSHVWKYFSREGDKAHCKVEGCKAMLAIKSTSSLSYHLEKTHKIVKSTAVKSHNKESSTSRASTSQAQLRSQEDNQEQPREKKQKTILECLSFRSLEETVARMAAEDGITIRQITRSKFIQQALSKEFPKRTIPKTERNNDFD